MRRHGLAPVIGEKPRLSDVRSASRIKQPPPPIMPDDRRVHCGNTFDQCRRTASVAIERMLHGSAGDASARRGSGVEGRTGHEMMIQGQPGDHPRIVPSRRDGHPIAHRARSNRRSPPPGQPVVRAETIGDTDREERPQSIGPGMPPRRTISSSGARRFPPSSSRRRQRRHALRSCAAIRTSARRKVYMPHGYITSSSIAERRLSPVAGQSARTNLRPGRQHRRCRAILGGGPKPPFRQHDTTQIGHDDTDAPTFRRHRRCRGATGENRIATHESRFGDRATAEVDEVGARLRSVINSATARSRSTAARCQRRVRLRDEDGAAARRRTWRASRIAQRGAGTIHGRRPALRPHAVATAREPSGTAFTTRTTSARSTSACTRSRASLAQRFPWCEQVVFDAAGILPTAQLSRLPEAGGHAARRANGLGQSPTDSCCGSTAGTVFRGHADDRQRAPAASFAGRADAARKLLRRTDARRWGHRDRREPYRRVACSA